MPNYVSVNTNLEKKSKTEDCEFSIKDIASQSLSKLQLYIEFESNTTSIDYEAGTVLAIPVYVQNSCLINEALSTGDSENTDSVGEVGSEINDDPYLTVLRDIFKLQHFREGQREIIEPIGKGNDSFSVLPTGGGKTVCFGVPSVLFSGVTVVIAPLISLMYNLQQRYTNDGIVYKAVSNSASGSSLRDLEHDLLSVRPSTKVVLITPESLTKCQTLKNCFKSIHLRKMLRFVIDEAHCITECGHSYRKDYLDLANIKQTYNRVQICAFTATATLET